MATTKTSVDQILANKDNEQRSDQISQSKDKAQGTSSSAMSVINVALLKDLITGGPEAFPHHTLLLSLVCIALSLQIVIGILTLYVSHLQPSDSEQIPQDCISETFDNLCCCSIRCKKARVEDPGEGGSGTAAKSTDERVSQIQESFMSMDKLRDVVRRKIDEENQGCCPLIVSGSTLPDEQQSVVDTYQGLCGLFVQLEVEEKEAEMQIKSLETVLQRQADRLEQLEAKKDNEEVTLEEFSEKAAEIQVTVDKATDMKIAYLRAKDKMDVVQEIGPILRQKADSILRREVLRKIAFWQSIINYMLYAVFITNAFITGLWMDSGETPGKLLVGGAGNSTTTA